MSYCEKSDRWLDSATLTDAAGRSYVTQITMHSRAGAPHSTAKADVMWFTTEFAALMAGIIAKLESQLPDYGNAAIVTALPGTLYLFAPGTVNSVSCDILLLFELESEAMPRQSVAVQYCDRRMEDIEVHR